MTLNLKKELNQAQYQAVTTIDKPVLVIAGAGSGKTRVIEYRVLHLIQQGISPENILLLTFTRKAAQEMLTRVAKHDPRCELIDGGTFHSFAFKILKRYAHTIGFDNSFSILDDSDGNEAIAACMTKTGLVDLKRRFPKKDTLKSIISKSINKQVSIANVLEREYAQFAEFTQEIEKLRQAYSRYKLDNSYVDYDDLLVFLKIILERQPLRDQIASQYKHVMVDEYQDTNKLQGDIAYLLAESHGNIMAVGDDAQSIYGFRGASHANIMDFPVRFPNCEIIILEQNYRSTQYILDVSNSILDNMTHKYEKRLESAKNESGLTPELLCFKNPYEEASHIAQSILMMRDEGISLGRQAVLFRSAYISISLQAELTKYNIPFQVYGGLKFYETAHVKDMVGFLKVLQNHRDELAWGRILKLLEGIGPKTVEKIVASIKSSISLTAALLVIKEKFGEGLSYSESLNKLIKMFEAVNKESLRVGDQFNIILDYYKPVVKKTYDDFRERLDDLQTLLDIAQNYKSLNTLLSDLALDPPERGVAQVNGEVEDERPLTLSTIHSAKGLEWEIVFVIGLIDGVLPSRFSLNFDDQLEEEHRLFYVAVTRAKRQLYLTMHHEGAHGNLYQFNRISRFLENRNILERLEQRLVDESLEKKYREKPSKNRNKIRLVSDELAGEKLTKESLFKKINDSWKW